MKGTKLYSIFKGKCPRCHEGDFFVEKHPYKLSKMAHIHKACSVCGEAACQLAPANMAFSATRACPEDVAGGTFQTATGAGAALGYISCISA